MDPNDIEGREFATALRGYDREEVDTFLRVVGAEVRRLQKALKKQAAPPPEGAPTPAAGAAPAPEPPAPGDAPALVEASTSDPVEASTSDPVEAYRQVGDETARILVAAEQAAREIKERGQREVAELLADARDEAAAIARAAVAERESVEGDIRQLQEARGLLGTEMEDMRRRFEELVLRLRRPFDIRRPKPKMPEAKRPPAPPPPAAPAALDGEEPVVVVRAGARAGVKAGGPPPSFGAVNGNGPPGARVPEAAAPPEPSPLPELPPLPGDPQGALDWRGSALGEMPADAAARLKRLLQDDQNELLERLRTWRGVGPAANHVLPLDRHAARFAEGLREVLEGAFQAGRHAGGSADPGDPAPTIGALVTKQLVTPLRRDLLRLIEPPAGPDASATAASRRASDVYRVWKGVRTDLLGEGLVYAVFHRGLLDAAKEDAAPGNGSASKEWIVSADEHNCPKEVCRSNASAGPVGLDASFPSGHLLPPAHGGCTCTLLLVRG